MSFGWCLREFSCCCDIKSNLKVKGFIWIRDSGSQSITVVKRKHQELVAANYITSTVRSKE